MSMETPFAKFLRENYPGQDPQAVLAGPLAIETFGKLPRFSGRDTYQILSCTGGPQGNFAVAYAFDNTSRDPATQRMGEPYVAIQKRADKGPLGEDRFGALGGFASLDDNPRKNMCKEQPAEGCAREISEELVDDKGVPILSLDHTRLNLLSAGNDFRKDTPVSYNGFSLQLTPEELQAIRRHSERMQNDPAYAATVKEESEGEVAQIFVKPLSEVLKMKKEEFTHPHEYEGYAILSQKLEAIRQATVKR